MLGVCFTDDPSHPIFKRRRLQEEKDKDETTPLKQALELADLYQVDLNEDLLRAQETAITILQNACHAYTRKRELVLHALEGYAAHLEGTELELLRERTAQLTKETEKNLAEAHVAMHMGIEASTVPPK